MTREGFEITIQVFERSKTVCVLDGTDNINAKRITETGCENVNWTELALDGIQLCCQLDLTEHVQPTREPDVFNFSACLIKFTVKMTYQ